MVILNIKDLEEMINIYKKNAKYNLESKKDENIKIKQLDEVLKQDLPQFIHEYLEELRYELSDSVNYHHEDLIFAENMVSVLSTLLHSDKEIVVETTINTLQGKLNNCNKEWLGLWVDNEQQNIHVQQIINISIAD